MSRGKSEKKITEQQLQLNNQLVQQQLARQNQLINMGLPAVQSAMGQGFDPKQLAAMIAQTIQSTNQQFNTGEQAVKAALGRRGFLGGATPASGLAGQGLGAMEAQRGTALSGNLANISIQDALAHLQNIWQGANQLGSYASLFTPAPFSGAASSSLGSRVQAGAMPSFGQDILSGLIPKWQG